MTKNNFYLKKEYAKVIHQLLCERMDEIFAPLSNDENWKPTKEQQLIMDAVCSYSAQLPYGWNFIDDFNNEELKEWLNA